MQALTRYNSFLAGACAGGVIGVIACWGLPQLRRLVRKTQPPFGEYHLAADEALRIYDEQLVRTRQFFGEEGLERLKNAYVIIVGVGGVGSHCAVSLARSGVGHLRLIDFDQVSVSSLNRHACATREDVGLPKVHVLRDHIARISPHIQVDTYAECFLYENATRLLLGETARPPDFVIDCIDNIVAKVDLITFCQQQQIRCTSSGGAGGKIDPTKIRIDDLCLTTEDSLCRAIRGRLRRRGITTNCLICYSLERESKGLLPLHSFQEGSVDEFRPLDNFRVRIMPVIAPLPAIFGQALSSFVLSEVSHQPIPNLLMSTREANAESRITRKNYKQLFDAIKQSCNGQGQSPEVATENLELSYQETRWLYIDVFKGMCFISKKQPKLHTLELVPWRCVNNSLLASLKTERNVICIEKKLARQHLKTFPSPLPGAPQPLSLNDVWDAQTIAMIDTFLRTLPPKPASCIEEETAMTSSLPDTTGFASSVSPSTPCSEQA